MFKMSEKLNNRTCKDCAYYNYVLCFDDKGVPNTNPYKNACKFFKKYIKEKKEVGNER